MTGARDRKEERRVYGAWNKLSESQGQRKWSSSWNMSLGLRLRAGTRGRALTHPGALWRVLSTVFRKQYMGFGRGLRTGASDSRLEIKDWDQESERRYST